MALDTAVYLVTKEIAIRSGVIDNRYRIADGRFVLDNKDLARVRFTTDEYISGLSGVEKVSELTAQQLVAQNGYQRGRQVTHQQNETLEEPVEATEEATEQNNSEGGIVTPSEPSEGEEEPNNEEENDNTNE